MGVHTILNDDMIKEAAEAIKDLYYVESVADYIGITKVTIYDWLEKGEAELEALEATGGKFKLDKVGLYGRFAYSLKKARADNKRDLARNIREAPANNGWQNRAWLLERCFPSEFGRRDATKVELSAASNQAIQVMFVPTAEAKAAQKGEE